VAAAATELAALPLTGSILREYWTNLPGEYYSTILTSHPDYPGRSRAVLSIPAWRRPYRPSRSFPGSTNRAGMDGTIAVRSVATGSRTITAGSELPRPRGTLVVCIRVCHSAVFPQTFRFRPETCVISHIGRRIGWH